MSHKYKKLDMLIEKGRQRNSKPNYIDNKDYYNKDKNVVTSNIKMRFTQ